MNPSPERRTRAVSSRSRARARRTVLVLLACVLLVQVPSTGATHGPPLHYDRLEFGGELQRLPSNTLLVILDPREGYSPDEAGQLRVFLERGGRVLLGGLQGSGGELLARLNVNATVPDAGLLSLDVPAGVLAKATGQWRDLPGMYFPAPVAPILGAGQTILVSSEYTWFDEDNDQRPDLNERKGEYAVAKWFAVGDGDLLVVSDAILFREEVSPVLSAGLLRALTDDGERDVVLDVSHDTARRGYLLIGAAASDDSTAVQTSLVVAILFAPLVVLGARIRRRPDAARRARPLPPPRTPLESRALAELDR